MAQWTMPTIRRAEPFTPTHMPCRLNAQSTDEELKYDVILVSLGSRYQMYCSNVSRTYLVDPSKTQEAQYKTLLEAQAAAINALKPGKPMSDAYSAAVSSLKVMKPPWSHM